MISQLTVFIENEEGRLASMCRVVSDAGINMHALFLADTETFGVARIFCDTPNAACDALRNAGYRASVTPVIAVKVPNEPAGLADLLDFLNQHAFNIEYGYCLPSSSEYAVDVLKIDDLSAETTLEEAGYESVRPEDIYAVD